MRRRGRSARDGRKQPAGGSRLRLTHAARPKKAGGDARSKFWVYVIELRQSECVKACRGKTHCRDKSLHMPCLYVGSSYFTPRERLAKHREGHRWSRHVGRAGLKLRYDLMPSRPFPTREKAERAERELAVRLRARFTVFQG